MGVLKGPHDEIYNHYAKLVRQWRSVSTKWDDPLHDQFEKDYWSKYEPILRKFLDRLELLDRTIEQAHREVK